jgi:hypothetical protein
MLFWVGAVAEIHWIKNKDRIFPIEPEASRFIEAANCQFKLTLKGVMAGKKPEEQYG